MMIMIIRWLLITCGLWALLVYTPTAAHAHDGGPRIELSAERLNPGATVEVRGINIAPDMPIKVALVGNGVEVPLGDVVGNEHGDFVQAFVVPQEVAAGDYVVQAITPSQITAIVVSAPLTIFGSPVSAGAEDGELRAEEEPLLATLPPGWGRTQAQPALPPAPASTPAPANVEPAPATSSAPSLQWPVGLALLGVVTVIALSVAIATRRRAARAR